MSYLGAAQIPMSADSSPAQVGNVLANVAAFQKVQQNAKALAGQNKLMQLMGDPKSMDAQGNLTPQALQAVGAIDPDAMMKIKQSQLDAQIAQAQAHHYQTEAGKAKFDFGAGIAGAAADAYDDSIEAGASPKDATAKAIEVRRNLAMNNGGVLDDDAVKSIITSPFDRMQAGVYASTSKAWESKADKAKKLALDTRKEDAKEAIDDRREDRMIAAIGAGQNKTDEAGWDLRDMQGADGKSVSVRINKRTGEVLPVELPDGGKGALIREGSAGQALDPEVLEHNAKAIAEYRQPPPTTTRAGSPGAAIMAKVNDINPDYDTTKYTAKNAAVRAFDTGKQGDITRSMNVGISHLDTIDKAAEALANGDIKAINRLGNWFEEETGRPAPVTFDAMKQIVADEIVKSVVGYSGAVNDRESMQAKLDRANSPEQLLAVTKSFRDLMSGQLRGLGKQYENATGLKDFAEKLLPETKKALGYEEAARPGGKSTPQTGDVIKGYRFKGGDPADKDSWEKVP